MSSRSIPQQKCQHFQSDAATRWTRIAELESWCNNPRINRDAVPAVARSIERFGFVAPIVAWRGRIVAGHTRLAALEGLLEKDPHFTPRGAPGPGVVPVRFVEFANEAEANAYAIADNRLAEIAEWDEAKLAELFEELRRLDDSLLADTGFSAESIDKLIREAGGAPLVGDDPGPDLDRATELQEKWQTETRQRWEIASRTVPGKSHRILCGDARRPDAMRRLMNGARADLAFTDPPYGVDYEGRTSARLKIQHDVAVELPALLGAAFSVMDVSLVEGAAIYVAHPAGPLSLKFGQAILDVGWDLHQTLIWVKDALVLGRSDYHYRHEPIYYASKSGQRRSWYGGRTQVSTLEVPRPRRSEDHPTVKPVELIEICVRNSSRAGALVLDPFLGSGSTIVAAERNGRLGYGMEIDPKYVAVALERFTGMGLSPRRL